MLQQLLNCPVHDEHPNYEYLPVSTSLPEQLLRQANELLVKSHKAVLKKQDEFIPNEETENIKEELIMLKLKGYINQRDITGKSTEIRKLPNKVQVGTMIEGDPILKTKIRSTKKHSSVIDYFLELDQQAKFTEKKFTELQRLNQRKRKIKRTIMKKRQKGKRANNK